MRTSMPNIAVMAPDPREPKHKFSEAAELNLPECPQIKIIRVDMSVYFGSLDHVQRRLAEISEKEKVKHILMVGESINFIDLAGAEMLIEEANGLRAVGGGLYIQGAKSKVYDFMDKIDFQSHFGQGNLFASKEAAIQSLTKRLDGNICATCKKRVFRECAGLPGAAR
jgi:SulP family sulfate permease